MRSFLQSAFDRALTILERERPFFSLGSLSMYILSLIAEIPVILARLLLVTIISVIVLVIENKSTSTFNWLYLALLPTGWSMLALITPIGSAWWWQTRAGGREPSQREQLTYDDAVELLQAHTDTPLPLPKRWFVIDTPNPTPPSAATRSCSPGAYSKQTTSPPYSRTSWDISAHQTAASRPRSTVSRSSHPHSATAPHKTLSSKTHPANISGRDHTGTKHRKDTGTRPRNCCANSSTASCDSCS